MSLPNIQPPKPVEVTVTFEGELTVVVADSSKTVGDVLKQALASLGVAEDHTACHLADCNNRVFLPAERLSEADPELELALRLPF